MPFTKSRQTPFSREVAIYVYNELAGVVDRAYQQYPGEFADAGWLPEDYTRQAANRILDLLNNQYDKETNDRYFGASESGS